MACAVLGDVVRALCRGDTGEEKEEEED